MNTQKYREIGVAGCCGAVAGTAVAIICDWSILMLVPSALIGAFTAFVCYRPAEAFSIVVALGHDVGHAARRMLQRPWRIPIHIEWHAMQEKAVVVGEALLVATRHVAIGVACVTLVCVSLLFGPSLAFVAGIALPFPDQKSVWGPIFWAIALAFSGYAGLFIFLSVWESVRGGSWYMPLTRWAGKVMWKPWDEEITMKRQLLYSGFFPLYMQIVGSILGVLLICDTILTIFLACASTERIAAILGAMLGLCAATVLHVCGVPGSLVGSLVILVASGTVGWYAGPFLCRLRAYLEREPAAETVRSS